MNFDTVSPGVRTAAELVRAGRIQYVSFDFFDTLVVRRCERPSDLFIELGARLERDGLTARVPGLASSEFRGLRRQAERMARARARAAGREGEIHLHEVYDVLLKGAGESEIEQAIACEIETEQDYLTFCPGIKPLLDICRERSVPYIITSDIYFSASQLRLLLDAVNAKLEPEDQIQPREIFTSADFGTSKHFDLFSHVLEKMDLPADALVHIGDNYQADVARPTALGLPAVFFERYRASHADILGLEARYREAMPADDYYIRAARSLADARDDDAAFSYGAFILGPIYAGFVFRLMAILRAGRADKLLFLTREGVFLRELLQLAADTGDWSEKSGSLPESSHGLLYVSRLALARCDVDSVDQAYLDSVRAEGRPMTMEQARNYAREQRRLFADYFKQCAGNARRIMLVDVGWQAQMQAYIARALKLEDSEHDLSGAYIMQGGRYRETALEHSLAMEALLPVSAHNDGFREAIYRAPLILELAAMPNFGTTLRYEKTSAGVEPECAKLAADIFPPELKRIQEGVRNFLRTYLSIARAIPESPEALQQFARTSQEILARAVLRPLKEETNIWRKVRQQEDVARSKPFLDARRKGRYSGLTFKEIQNHPDVFWPAGMVREMDGARAASYEEYELTGVGGYTRVRARWTLFGRFNYARRSLFSAAARERLLHALPGLARRFPLVKRLGPKFKGLVLRVLGVSRG